MKMLMFLLLACLSLFACQESSRPQQPNIKVPQQLLKDPEIRRQGALLFEKHCRECHGTMSEGRNPRATKFQPPAPDFLNPIYAQRDPAYLYWRISAGKGVEPYLSQGSIMPVFGPHLTEYQIWQLVAYLRLRATHPLNQPD